MHKVSLGVLLSVLMASPFAAAGADTNVCTEDSYKPGADVSMATTINGAVLTLTANYIGSVYKLAIDKNGGTGGEFNEGTDRIAVVYGKRVDPDTSLANSGVGWNRGSSFAPKKTGSKFTGYYFDNGGAIEEPIQILTETGDIGQTLDHEPESETDIVYNPTTWEWIVENENAVLKAGWKTNVCKFAYNGGERGTFNSEGDVSVLPSSVVADEVPPEYQKYYKWKGYSAETTDITIQRSDDGNWSLPYGTCATDDATISVSRNYEAVGYQVDFYAKDRKTLLDSVFNVNIEDGWTDVHDGSCPIAPEEANYSFNGWWTDSIASNPYINADCNIVGETVYVCKPLVFAPGEWNTDSCRTWGHDVDGPDEAPEQVEEWRISKFRKDNAWALTSDDPATPIKLYAEYTPHIYKITLDSDKYDSSDATNASKTANPPASPTTVYEKYATGWYKTSTFQGGEFTGLTTKPELDFHVFGGFYTGKAGTGTQVIDQSGTLVSQDNINTVMNDDNTVYNGENNYRTATIYAKWSECTISDEEDRNLTFTATVTNDNKCSYTWECKPGYVHKSDNQTGGTHTNEQPGVGGFDGNISCEPINFTINYNCGVGAAGTVASTTCTWGDTGCKAAAGTGCSKAGYTFSEWSCSVGN